MLREKSDYEDFYVPNKDETADVISKVEVFLKNVESYLKAQSVI